VPAHDGSRFRIATVVGNRLTVICCRFLFLLKCLVSSQHKWNLEELMEEIWERTNMLRIYPKVGTIAQFFLVAYGFVSSSNVFMFVVISQKGKYQTTMSRLYYERKILRLKNFVTDCTKVYWPSFHTLGFVCINRILYSHNILTYHSITSNALFSYFSNI
jgi:hypothetical protein